MNKRIVSALIKKDIKSMLLSKRTWGPMLLVSILLCILLPAAIAYGGAYKDNLSFMSGQNIDKTMESVVDRLPSSDFKEQLMSLDTLGQKFSFFFLSYQLVSIFLMVTVINSMVTATSSFVSEKERGTLETLLFSPITIKELFVGKILASFIPSIIITYVAYLASFALINSLTFKVFHSLLFINPMWLLLMFWVVPALVLFNILLNVLISAKMKTYQEAQQFGGLLILPFVGLIVSQATGLFLVSPMVLIILGALLYALVVGLLLLITKMTKRNSLFESQIH
ncbi:hypothetical protein CN918_31430 [Priestia megaterium]|nr:hypothetical protein CN918_31430 [Priestia megaterium]